MFKTRIRLKTITTTAEENTYLASFTPEKGDGYVFINEGKAVQKIYDGTKWNSSSLGDVTEAEMNAAIESVRLQVTESSEGNLVVRSLGVAPVSYEGQSNEAVRAMSARVSESPIEYSGDEILMFNKGICIGDDITEGMFNYNSPSAGSTQVKKYSYPAVLNKKGVVVSNAGISGVTTGEWNAARQAGSSYSGSWDSNGEWLWNSTGSAGLSLNGYDFAIIQLGINDCLNNVDTTTFASNLGAILGALKNTNNKISIFLCTLTPVYSSANSAMSAYNEVIRALVPAMKDTMNIHLIDLAQYSKCLPNTAYVNTHLTALGYTQMANEIYAMISYTINQNLDDFKNVQFNGTNYSV